MKNDNELLDEWEVWAEEAFGILPEEADFVEVATAAYMLLCMYNIPIDLACEAMLKIYQQDMNLVPKEYLLN